MARKPLGGLGRPANPCTCCKGLLGTDHRQIALLFYMGYTKQNTSVQFMSVDDPLGDTTDWHYGRGVLVRVTKHERSIHFSRQFMRPHHSLALRSWGPRSHNKTHVFDSGHSTTHGVTPPTGVTVVASPYTEHDTNVRFRSFDDP